MKSLHVSVAVLSPTARPQVRLIARDPSAYEALVGGPVTRVLCSDAYAVYAREPELPLFCAEQQRNARADRWLRRRGIDCPDTSLLLGTVIVTGAPDEDGWDTDIPASLRSAAAPR